MHPVLLAWPTLLLEPDAFAKLKSKQLLAPLHLGRYLKVYFEQVVEKSPTFSAEEFSVQPLQAKVQSLVTDHVPVDVQVAVGDTEDLSLAVLPQELSPPLPKGCPHPLLHEAVMACPEFIVTAEGPFLE